MWGHAVVYLEDRIGLSARLACLRLFIEFKAEVDLNKFWFSNTWAILVRNYSNAESISKADVHSETTGL